MIAAIITTASLVTFAQLGLSYWRATLSRIAAQAISERVRMAAGIMERGICGQDFRKIMILKDLSPDLRGPNESFTAIRAYYNVVEKLGNTVPGVAGWSRAEMATCSRYAAFLMDQQLERNRVYATQLRGM